MNKRKLIHRHHAPHTEKCHLINSAESPKIIHNGKEIKKIDEGDCRATNIVYAARCKIHGDIHI